MVILKILGILSLALSIQEFQHTDSASVIETVTFDGDENEVTEKSLECVHKYFAFQFKDMSRARFNLIYDPSLHRSRVEQLFVRDGLHNPITLTTLASIDEIRLKNYLIFLSSDDAQALRNISIPTAHVKSFLYIVYEQNNASVSMRDIHSIFASSFEQNVVIMMTSQTNQDPTEWSAFRVVLLLKCMNSSEYKMVQISHCHGFGRGSHDFRTFPLKHLNTVSCPVQVYGRLNSPFTYYDSIRGIYDGIDYHLIRTISSQ